MSVKSQPYYFLVCDGCGTLADYADYTAWADEDSALGPVDDGEWTTDGKKHHCSNCPPLHKEGDCPEDDPCVHALPSQLGEQG